MPKKIFAENSWVVEDVLEYAEQYDYKVTRREALRLLDKAEEDIIEAMTAAGWEVIDEALRELHPES